MRKRHAFVMGRSLDGAWTISCCHTMINELKDKHEPAFKKDLAGWMETEAFNSDPSLKKKIENFIAGDYVYFHDNAFLDAELMQLNEICNESWVCVNDFLSRKFKTILKLQLKYI